MHHRLLALVPFAVSLLACPGGDGGDVDDTSHDATADVVDDVSAGDGGAETTPDGSSTADTTPDGATDASADGGADVDDGSGDAPDADAVPDTDAEAPCDEGAVTCSDDGNIARACVDGDWVDTACMADHGQLCADGACVDPWRLGDPVWSTCPDEPRDAGVSLADKAAYYDEIATRLHIHPELGWMTTVSLATEEVECPEGEAPPCIAPVRDVDEATWEDVVTWHSGANDGLWSALYLTSQAFRYAVTGSDEALETVRMMVNAERQRAGIAGVPGILVRSLRPPDFPGLACPPDPMSYVPDVEKDDERWVRIDDAGCASVYDPDATEFRSTDHCGLEEFAGWCFLDNVSQDEYAGHMMALTAVWRLVDDPEIQGWVAELADEIGTHLVENELTFVDWDGRVTEHGKLYATALVDSPGFLAAQALAWVKFSAEVTGREDLHDFYEECLLQQTDTGRCMSWPLETGDPYHTDKLPVMILYVGTDGCVTNFNRLSMVSANLWTLLQVERDPAVRAVVQDVLDAEVYHDDSSRSIDRQGNAWFDFMWAATKALGPESSGPAHDAVESAICSLRQFPARKTRPNIDHSERYERHCAARLGDDATLDPIPVADRCPSGFLWWRSPYGIGGCSESETLIEMPGDYLLAYWMGRYYGFIGPDL